MASRKSEIEHLARGETSILTALLDILAEAVTIRDVDGAIVYANRAALATMGMSAMSELLGQDGRALLNEFIAHDEHGRRLTLEDLPGRKVVNGSVGPPLLMRVTDPSGTISWRLLKATALLDDDGELAGAMTVIEDVSAVKLAEERTRVLAESGRILASSLDYEETLRNVAHLAVPALADYCGVDLLDDDGILHRVAAAHRDASKSDLVGRLQEIEHYRPDPESTTGGVLRSGTSALFDPISPAQLTAAARSATHLALGHELGPRAAMFVPMVVPTRTIGLMTLFTTESRRRFSPDDVALAEQLARRAAVAVENSRLHTTLTGVARTLQASLRPNPLPTIPGWEVAALYRPAQSELRVDVGGDFYEFFEHGDTWFAIVGDVTGKGVAAAAMTALMRHGARVASRSEPAPAAILQRLDEALKQQADPSLCTAICVALHDRHVTLSSAGHPPALLVCSASGAVRRAPVPGPLLGAFDDAQWTEDRTEISPGELLVLFTDGVIETRGREERYGIDRLTALAATHSHDGPAAFLGALEASLDAFAHGPLRDDVAAVALRASAA